MFEQSKPKEEVVHTETDSRNYQYHCVEVGIVTFWLTGLRNIKTTSLVLDFHNDIYHGKHCLLCVVVA